MPSPTVIVLHAKGALDVDTGDVVEDAFVTIDDGRIASVSSERNATADADEVMELPDLTLVPGLMDMEVDLVLGGPGAGLSDPVRLDPVKMTLRAVANGQRTLRAGFTTVRNLGLFVKTNGYLLDVDLADAIDAGWVAGPRVIPAGHAICPTGGHLDPSAQSGLAPHVMRLSVEEGIADGVDEVRKAVRYQIKHGAKLIKCVASGGVMTPTGPPGAQQYSTEELTAIADEAHRRGLKVAWILDTHPHADHFSAARYLRHRTGAPTAIGEKVIEVQKLWRGFYNWPDFPADGSQWDKLFADGERFRIGDLDASVMLSPGHTLASITYLVGDAAVRVGGGQSDRAWGR